MGREAPMNPTPAGKPSVASRDSVKSMGSFPGVSREGNKEFPGYKGEKYLSSQGAKAASKGKFETAPTPGNEYRQENY